MFIFCFELEDIHLVKLYTICWVWSDMPCNAQTQVLEKPGKSWNLKSVLESPRIY